VKRAQLQRRSGKRYVSGQYRPCHPSGVVRYREFRGDTSAVTDVEAKLYFLVVNSRDPAFTVILFHRASSTASPSDTDLDLAFAPIQP
jgi:hypothetical protein